jgi:membrane-associated protease RseP (regulator of RpoE activity)
MRPRYWLHALLLALTLVSTSAMGALMVENFRQNRPAFDLNHDVDVFVRLWSDPLSLAAGLPFSLPLMAILLAHEFGHFFACRYYGVDASLPYFIPFPTFIGTLGAFIRIRSPIYSKRVLFDVGVAGPLAGFAALLPALSIGLAYSRILPGIGHRGDVIFGAPLLLRAFEAAILPGVASSDIYLHPVARAAWVGMFATALNLLPIGQLDGGHILYSFLSGRHRQLSRFAALALVPMGVFVYWPWLAWALALLWFGLRHPPIFDATPLGSGRRNLAWMALAIFVLCFMPAPTANMALLRLLLP